MKFSLSPEMLVLNILSAEWMKFENQDVTVVLQNPPGGFVFDFMVSCSFFVADMEPMKQTFPVHFSEAHS